MNIPPLVTFTGSMTCGAFGTVNAKTMKPEVLQKMMRHKTYKTTLGYINLATQIEDVAKNLVVPDTLQKPDTTNPRPTAGNGEAAA